MVEIFKTNVQDLGQAKRLLENLSIHFPVYQINFDLDDCDKILRVEGEKIQTREIANLINANGFECEILE